MSSPLIEILRHNDWANRVLIDACAELDDAQLDAADLEGIYGSIRDTLLHIASAQTRYVQRLKGEAPTQGEQSGFDSFDALKSSLEESGRSLAQIAAGSDLDEDMESNFMAKRFKVKRWLLMVQAINHATEHRTQIKSMMSAMGLTPPEIDGWSFGYSVGALIES